MSKLTVQFQGGRTIVFDSKKATFAWSIEGSFIKVTEGEKVTIFPSHVFELVVVEK